MISGIRTVGSIVLLSSITAVVLAQVPALDVKMGLWEITSTSQVGGSMPSIDTSKMTPEQKAQMEAAMKSMMGAHQNVAKSCITKEKFEKEGIMPAEKGQDCKQTIVTNTRAALDAKVVCTGDRPMTAQLHADALSSTSFKATIKSSTTDQGKQMTVDVAMTGKWLAADCGSVK
jgi:hypothetical protein